MDQDGAIDDRRQHTDTLHEAKIVKRSASGQNAAKTRSLDPGSSSRPPTSRPFDCVLASEKCFGLVPQGIVVDTLFSRSESTS